MNIDTRPVQSQEFLDKHGFINTKKKKPKRHRAYWCTYNNYPQDWEDRYNRIWETGKFTYIVGGVEVGDSGTPHIQTHFNLKNGMSIKAIQKVLQKCGVKATVGIYKSKQHQDNGTVYPEKDGNFKTWGTPPSPGKRNDLEDVMDDLRHNPTMSRRQLFEEHASVMARYPRFAAEYQNMVREYKTLDWKEPPNLWIWGPPGVGKSRRIHEDEHSLYTKGANKWFDYYQGEHTVMLEDIDPTNMRYLSHFLKIWADRYPFLGQIKGSAMKIRPERVVVTSNYSLDDPEFGFDEVTLNALKRRFQVIHMR